MPTLILIGAKDDWSSASACEQMVAGARGRSARSSIKVYTGAYHDFDHPDLPVKQVKGLAFTANGDGVAHTGTNPAARADAIQKVPAFLAQ